MHTGVWSYTSPPDDGPSRSLPDSSPAEPPDRGEIGRLLERLNLVDDLRRIAGCEWPDPMHTAV